MTRPGLLLGPLPAAEGRVIVVYRCTRRARKRSGRGWAWLGLGLLAVSGCGMGVWL